MAKPEQPHGLWSRVGVGVTVTRPVTSSYWYLEQIESSALRVGEELLPLRAAKSKWHDVRIFRATDQDSIANCRDLDTRATIARLAAMPHQFTT